MKLTNVANQSTFFSTTLQFRLPTALIITQLHMKIMKNPSINLTDPGWCRTDLGGPNAPNDPGSVIPGICVGAFIDDKKSGRNLGAQAFAGMTLEDAVKKAEDFEQLF